MWEYLSHTINENTPLYGGNKNIKILFDKSIKNGDSCNTLFLNFPNHTGTHIDFPFHFSNSGKSINDYSASFWVFNKPAILDFPFKENKLVLDPSSELPKISPKIDFLILRTGFEKFRNEEQYWRNNPGLDPDFAEKLKSHCPEIRAVAMDFISVSSFQSREIGRIAHKKFLIDNDILLIEDVKVAHLNFLPEQVIGLPLMIDNADGVPISLIAKKNV